MLELGLEGKVAAVTGASDGLGRALAERLAAEGMRVAICARRAEHLEAAAAAIREATGGAVLAVPTDVTRPAEVDAFVDAVSGRFGGIDVLVNNAGTSLAKPLAEVTEDEWHYDLELKLLAAARTCRRVVPLMRARGGGSIVNVTTVGGKAPTPGRLPTSVSRAAGINLTKALAGEYAADNIRVNTVCIGLVRSAQWERRAAGRDLEAFYAEMGKRVPLGRLGEAAEFADLVAFLVSARGAYITGTAVNLDGGMCAVV